MSGKYYNCLAKFYNCLAKFYFSVIIKFCQTIDFNIILPDNWIYQIQSRESNTKNDVYRTSVFNRAKSKFCLDSELRIFETNFRFRFSVWCWLIFVTLRRIFFLVEGWFDEKYFGVTRNHAQSYDNIFFLSSNPGMRHHLSPGTSGPGVDNTPSKSSPGLNINKKLQFLNSKILGPRINNK